MVVWLRPYGSRGHVKEETCPDLGRQGPKAQDSHVQQVLLSFGAPPGPAEVDGEVGQTRD